MQYIPVLILDEDDTPFKTSMSLKSFLEEIENHTKNIRADPEDFFVQIGLEEYEDDYGHMMPIGQISFYVKKND